MKILLPAVLLMANVVVTTAAPPPADHAERMARGLQTFQKSIQSLLTENCLKCHGGEKTKSELDLSSREGLLKGGSGGPAVIPFDASQSRLVQLIRHEKEPHMPHEKTKLPEEAIRQIAAWIEDGAPYAEPIAASIEKKVTEQDRQWWSFKPLAKISPPRRAADANPVDDFIAAKGAGKRLALAARAEKRTLIRRAYLDLLGLPPPPEELDAFIRDTSSDAWPRLIDRLLASPHYGERWARHWLDVARFAESSGFEHDYDRPGAYHYRDFVIKALNNDIPYDQFVHWQIAGDEFEPDNPLALSATGFLGAGVFPTQITANEVERTRYDALDDMLSTTGSAFLGLTVGCARCHDHKYDPIPATDYYRLLSTFTTTVRSVLDLDVEPEKTRSLLRKWESAHAPLVAEAERYQESLKPDFERWLADGAPLPRPAAWTLLDLTNLNSKAGATFRKLDDGSYLAEGKNGDQDEYSFIATTALRRVNALRLDALADPSMKQNGPGRADNGNIGLSRLRVFAWAASGGATQEVKIAKALADFEQNQETLSVAGALDDKPQTGWAVDPQFGKNHTAIFSFVDPIDDPSGVTLRVKLEFAVNTRHNIGRPRLAITTNAEFSLQTEVVPARVGALLAQAKSPGFAENLSEADRTILFDWRKQQDPGWRERNERVAEHAKIKPDGKTKVLVCTEGNPPLRMHTQGADFFPESYFLKRGNPEMKNGIARPGFLQVLMRRPEAENRWEWTPPPGAKFSGRRRALATWLTDVEDGAGALVARVMVNRLWQHHFGRGLVPTANDFGRAGSAPSHSELLDWLAGELVQNGWKLKPIHKLIMTSATYLQSSAADPAKEAEDPDNQLFLRRVPRRLEGEAIRDSILAVSGVLDPTLFGPGTRDERSRRRSIYFTIKRSQLIGSMVAFDQPEPLVSQGARPTTTVAPQALLLMNGPQVREWAEGFARRLQDGAATPAEAQVLVARAYSLAFGRPPTAQELNAASQFLEAQANRYATRENLDGRFAALTDFCQVLFGLNEFCYEN